MALKISLRTGKKDRRLLLQSPTTAKNVYNEDVATFATFATVWAEKTELSGTEQLLAQQMSAVVLTQFRIYWRSDVTTLCRVIVDGVTYQITYIAEVGRRKGLDLTCTTVAA